MVELAAELLVAGRSDLEITANLLEKGFKGSASDALMVIAEGYQEIARRFEGANERVAWHVAARLHVYKLALEIHAYDQARLVLADLARIEGLYDLAKSGPVGDGDEAGDDENDEDGIPSINDIEFPTQPVQ